MLSLTETMTVARTQHQGGDVWEAARLYRRVLREDPTHAEALSLLGAACLGLGKPAEAVDLLQQAVRLRPSDAAAHDNLGVGLAGLGQPEEAVASFRRVLRL